MAEYKCTLCDYRSKTKAEMRAHIINFHPDAATAKAGTAKGKAKAEASNIKAADYSGISLKGLVLGLVLGYIGSFGLAYLLGYILDGMIFAVLAIYLLNDAYKKNDRFLRGVVIGMLGILLGFLINWIVGLARTRSSGYKLIVSFVSWLIVVGIFVVISFAFAAGPPSLGKTYSLQPGYYLHWPFTLSTTTTVSCTFTSGSAPVEAYLMSNNSFSAYSKGYVYAPFYQSGVATSISIGQSLPAGEWDLVIDAPSYNLVNSTILFQNCSIP